MLLSYIGLGYLAVGTILVLFYIGAAGYPHRFSWKMLRDRLLEVENLKFALILIVIWLPALVCVFIRGMWDRLKERK